MEKNAKRDLECIDHKLTKGEKILERIRLGDY